MTEDFNPNIIRRRVEFANRNDIYLFTLSNKNGIQIEITNYGGIIKSISTPDNSGNFEDIVLGFDQVQQYLDNPFYFGATIGRYTNRIKDAAFTIEDKTFSLSKNLNGHALHGGKIGFDKHIWEPKPVSENGLQGLELSRLSPHLEEGFPGNLLIKVQYFLTDNNEFITKYDAVTDQPTIINLTNHSYFNLGGIECQNILDHELKINAKSITEINDALLPTGKFIKVMGTPFDFNNQKIISDHILNLPHPQMIITSGYDHNYVLNKRDNSITTAALLMEPNSGRTLEVFTTEPGIQLYTSNHMNSINGKNNSTYGRHAGLCLETQHFPDSPNIPQFPSTMLRPNDTFTSTTIYKFSTTNSLENNT